MNDQELIHELREGNQKAFRALVDTYKKSVFNTVLGFVQHLENAEEVTQDVFIKIFSSIGNFEERSKLSTWIYRVSVNQALDFIRKSKRKKRAAMIISLFRVKNEMVHEPIDFYHPGVIVEQKEKAAILFKAISRLPDKQKTAFLLQKVEGCSQQKTAEIMQINEGAVESLLTRAKANLKKILINYYTS
ncbi:MAG TPA: RNA polymerase sigma factor [Mucilaginibacter sp.]|nr:RNA polymerase sigma factor [Mucilaginibacter sp.]